MTDYRALLSDLRRTFPQPVSDREHDAYFVFSILRAMDQVDSLKSHRPTLGTQEVIDFSGAAGARVPQTPGTIESVTDRLVSYLSGMFLWGHPRTQSNVVPPPSIPGILGSLLPSTFNPNLCSEEGSRGVSLAEAEAVSMTAALMGYDTEKSGGVFTFGGTGTLLYAIRIGMEKCCPGSGRTGLREQPVIVCSDQAHYAALTAAEWLGIGTDNVVKIPSSDDNEIRTCLLESELRRLLKEGRRIAAVIATMGTTDAFGLDDLRAIKELRDDLAEEFSLDYLPHLHADAVIGWAWSVFRDYDLKGNPLQFPDRTLRALAGTIRRIRHLPDADSIGVDYHKTGFAPYASSAFFVRDRCDLGLLSRDPAATPYLFQSGEYNPGRFTLETTRSGCGPMSAIGCLALFGVSGLQSLLAHLVTMAETLRARLSAHPNMTVLNKNNFGPVTLFRVYPDEVDTFQFPGQEQKDAAFAAQAEKMNDFNRAVFQKVHARALQGEGVVLSMTDRFRETDYGLPLVAIKSYIMSPFSDDEYVQAVLDSLEAARHEVMQENGQSDRQTATQSTSAES